MPPNIIINYSIEEALSLSACNLDLLISCVRSFFRFRNILTLDQGHSSLKWEEV